MKKYHELGHIVDMTKNIVGFVLIETSEGSFKNKRGTSGIAVNLNEFQELVRNNQVQFFEYDANSNKCIVSYTTEELKAIKKLKQPLLYGEDYFKADLRWSTLGFGSGDRFLNICVMKAYYMMKQPVVMISVYKDVDFYKDELKHIEKLIGLRCTKRANNVFSCLMPLGTFLRFFSEECPYNFITNADCLISGGAVEPGPLENAFLSPVEASRLLEIYNVLSQRIKIQ